MYHWRSRFQFFEKEQVKEEAAATLEVPIPLTIV